MPSTTSSRANRSRPAPPGAGSPGAGSPASPRAGAPGASSPRGDASSPRGERPQQGGDASAPALDAPLATHLRPRRSPRLVAAGVLLACLGGLGGALAYQQASHSNQVVVVQHTVPRGVTVHAGDLGVVTIGPAPGVQTVPASRIDELVGRQALVDLPQGSLVGDASVGDVQLSPGTSQLGLKLAAGRIPNQPMPAGTPVELVQVGSDKAQPGSFVVDARVVSAPQALPDGSSQVLDVAVPDASAQQVADLAARDLLVVVRKAGG